MKSILGLMTGVLLLIGKTSVGQKFEIGADAGRAYFHYKYKDFGHGYSNAPRANYGLIVSVSVTSNLNRNFFLETGLKFVSYEQYYATRLYSTAWEQQNPVFLIPCLVGFRHEYSKFNVSAKGGFLAGIMTNNFIADYYALVWNNPNVPDSQTRGTMYRDFTSFVPLVSLGVSFGYKVGKNWKTELQVNGAKGLTKITEFDIYYNDGSGYNDQRAKQWGNGDYISISLGIKYFFREAKR